jgi:transcriptional regulator with XRE-family HTH domain
MDITPQDVGRRIQAARRRKGWNQSDLARALRKARQHISLIEQGKQFPAVPLLREIAGVLGVSTDYLLGLTNDEEEQPRRHDARAVGVGR